MATGRHVDPRTLIAAEELAVFRRRSTAWGLAMIASAWAIIAAAIALVAWTPHPALWLVTVPLAIAVIGSRQLGLAILMHEGAHGGLAHKPAVNLWLSQWLCAYPVFAETLAYRAYHFQHHAHAQTDRDPDLHLSAKFPVTRASLRRKLLRDLTGQTGWKQRRAQFRAALGDPAWPWRQRLRAFAARMGRPLAVNLALWAMMAAAGVWWAYPLLWVVPLLTWQQMVTRIRNIAEHSLLDVGGDPLRVARTTRAGWIERLFFAPYWVNFHAEHHLMMYVPCYRLPALHRALARNGALEKLVVDPGYRPVLAAAAARMA